MLEFAASSIYSWLSFCFREPLSFKRFGISSEYSGPYEISTLSPYVNIFPPNSEELGSALLWCEDEKEVSIRELLSTNEGRRQFADWLLKLKDIEEEVISSLEKVL